MNVMGIIFANDANIGDLSDTRTIGSILGADGVISISKENVERMIQASFRGYTVSVDVSVTDAYAGIKFFETNLPSVDYTELENQIARAEGLNPDDYTADSWARVAAALEEAYKARNSIKQADVDAAAGNLRDAIDNLEKKPVVPSLDYTELIRQIERARSKNPADYTEESWARVDAALAIAIEALESTDQGVIDAAAGSLKDALDNLELKPVYHDPFFVNGTGTPSITSDKVYGYKVNFEDMYILIDTHAKNALTIEELIASIHFDTEHATSMEITIANTTQGERSGYVGTGAVLTVSIESSFTGTGASLSYAIYILGDVNGDGKVGTTDAAATLSAVVGSSELTEVQKLVANINNNTRLDIGDAALNLNKAVYPDDYASLINRDKMD